MLFGFGELLGAAVDFSLYRGDAGGLFLLLRFGFGGLFRAPLIFGPQLGYAGGLFRALLVVGELLSGDASSLLRAAFLLGALLYGFTFGAGLLLAFAFGLRLFLAFACPRFPGRPSGFARSAPTANSDSER